VSLEGWRAGRQTERRCGLPRRRRGPVPTHGPNAHQNAVDGRAGRRGQQVWGEAARATCQSVFCRGRVEAQRRARGNLAPVSACIIHTSPRRARRHPRDGLDPPERGEVSGARRHEKEGGDGGRESKIGGSNHAPVNNRMVSCARSPCGLPITPTPIRGRAARRALLGVRDTASSWSILAKMEARRSAKPLGRCQLERATHAGTRPLPQRGEG